MIQTDKHHGIRETVLSARSSLVTTLSLAANKAVDSCQGITKSCHGVAFSMQFRAHARTLFEEEGCLPPGWEIRGQAHRMAQTILIEPTSGTSLRLLKESRVTSNGVPHAGPNPARTSTWCQPPLDGLSIDAPSKEGVECLLLWNFDDNALSLRVVHPLSEGQLGGPTPYDFCIYLKHSTPEISKDSTFDTTEETNFFFLAENEDYEAS